MPTDHVNDRVAIVTGASRGIGRAIAVRLAEDGFAVGVNDLASQEADLSRLADHISRSGQRCVVLPGDVSDPAAVDAMVSQGVQTLGRLDVMVANAGVSTTAAMLDTTAEDWDHIMAVNVRSVFLCFKAAAERMIAQGGGGKLISAASVAAFRGGRMQSAYSASKFAIRGLTHSAAQELAPHGITVNAYCPGVVQTPMWDQIDEALTMQSGAPRGSALQGMTSQIALQRLETPEDVAGLVSYLASRDSNYMTGQSLVIDGGFFFN